MLLPIISKRDMGHTLFAGHMDNHRLSFYKPSRPENQGSDLKLEE